MQQYSVAFVLSVFMLVGFGGCIPSEPEAPTNLEVLMSETTPGELVAEFTEMAKEPEKWSEDFRSVKIVDDLNKMGPTTLRPILQIMSSPDSSPQTRLFTLQAVTNMVSAAYMQDVVGMLESEDPVIRACAITVIGHMAHPDVMKVLSLAMNDLDPWVRFSALSGKAIQGDPVSRQTMVDMYDEPETKELQKREIIRVVLRGPELTDLEFLLRALDEDFVHVDTRSVVAQVLGDFGDASAIAPLELSLGRYEDETYTKLASAAIEEIRKQGDTSKTDAQ